MTYPGLEGKNAMITGGGRGIGRALAQSLASVGTKVTLLSRTPGDLDEVVALIRQNGGVAQSIVGDVRKRADIERAVKLSKIEYGPVDILVNCAGVFSMGPSESISDDDWNSVLDTNLTGTHITCQVVGGEMIRQGYGKIVNFGSLLSFVAFPERAAYAASKAAIVQLTRVLGVEWIRYGVNVNAIVPGMVQVETPHPQNGDPAYRDRIIHRVPIGRLGLPNDIVNPTIFLVSDHANYIVGQTLVVDGGWLAYGYL